MQIVFDVFRLAEFARPTATRQLACGMSWPVERVGEQSNFLETRFRVHARAIDVAEGCESGTECLPRPDSRQAVRPMGFGWIFQRPPPIVRNASRPGDAVVDGIA